MITHVTITAVITGFAFDANHKLKAFLCFSQKAQLADIARWKTRLKRFYKVAIVILPVAGKRCNMEKQFAANLLSWKSNFAPIK